MMRRLFLGCGDVGRELLEEVLSWPGELRVVADDEAVVERLRDRGVAAVVGDPGDPAVVRGGMGGGFDASGDSGTTSAPGTGETGGDGTAGDTPPAVDVVIVAGDDPGTNRDAAEAARESFPDALVVAFAGVRDVRGDEGAWEGEPSETIARLREVADRVFVAREALVEQTAARVTGDDATRAARVTGLLRDLEGPLAVVTHDNPDPDAIASAVGVCQLAEQVGLEAQACYFGEIAHQENRALVNLLDLDLRNLEASEDVAEYASVALVDHSRAGVNDQLPADTLVDLVIDHHPPRGPVEARLLDLRSEAGATSTLVTEHFEQLALAPEPAVATALLYGIRIDTKEFTREVSGSDFAAAAALLPHVDTEVLAKVETPSVSADVLEIQARAIRDRRVERGMLTSCVGPITDRDALAQAADELLDMEGVRITLVYGFMDGTVFVSGRARGADLDLGETLRDAFDQIGSAGGHADMAGAQIPLGILADVDDEETDSLTRIVRQVIDGRFYEALEGAPTLPLGHEPFAAEFPE